jgi:hypothetical protein
MSQIDQFRQYADEALRGANRSKNLEEKEALYALARTWLEASVQSDTVFGVKSSPPVARRETPPTPRCG